MSLLEQAHWSLATLSILGYLSGLLGFATYRGNLCYFNTNGTLPPGCFAVDSIVLLFVASETFICVGAYLNVVTFSGF